MTMMDVDLVPDLAHAVEDGSLQLHFQPEVDLASGAVVGMEALLRWYHPVRGLLWPGEFLDVAETSGALVNIGHWVVSQCIQEAARWADLPVHPAAGTRQMWCNVSASQFADPRFVAEVASEVSAAGLPPGAFGVEVTEAAIAGRETAAVDEMRALREAGVALAIDDFGTWYSSLASIGELPVDGVKLDRKFVRGVGSDLEDDSIVASVIRLAHAHDLYVVAEGVESWAEGARLCELGCDRAHGYLFSGPQRAEKARWMLAKGVGWRGTFTGEAPTAN